jgi:phosphoribosylamine--glycine ligase
LTFLEAAAKGRLGEARPKFFPKTALAVVLTAKGYPTIVEKGSPISGIPEAQALSGVKIYHAGVTRKDNRLVSDGGRVLAVTGIADSVTGSRALAYGALDRINLPGGYFRRDIGVRALVRDDEG